MSEPIIVDIYCRVATSEPGSDALDKQEADCRAYCLKHGLIIGTVFREVASGSQYRDRQGLTKLRKRYKAGEAQGVIATTLDRLSRSQVHLVILMDEMEQHDITLYLVRESINNTALGSLARMLLVFIADLEREKALVKNPDGSKLD